MRLLSPDAVILEPLRAHARGVVEIAPIHHQRPVEQRLEPVEVGIAVHQPFGDDREGVGALGRRVRIGRVDHPVAEDLPGGVHRLRIVGLHPRPGSQQTLDQRDGRALPHVVGLGLEGEPPHPNRPPRERAVEGAVSFSSITCFCR